MEESRAGGRGLTVLVVTGDGVGCPVGILVLRDHHGDLELRESFGEQADADVPSALADISQSPLAGPLN